MICGEKGDAAGACAPGSSAPSALRPVHQEENLRRGTVLMV